MTLDRMARLMIRTEIEALNAEFAYLIDHDRSHLVADLFVEGGSYGFLGGGRSSGREAIREAYRLRAARGVRTARHIYTNLRLDIQDEDTATGTTILLLFAEDGPPPHPAQPLEVSDFEDEYVRDADGTWKYKSRTIRPLFRHPSKQPVIPLGASAEKQ